MARALLVAGACALSLPVAAIQDVDAPAAGSAPAASADRPAPLDALLDEAEALRTADRHRFAALVDALNLRAAEASPAQLRRLEVLNIYDLANSGRYDLAIGRGRALFEHTDDVATKFRVGALVVNGLAATREFGEALRVLDATLALSDQIRDPQLLHHGLAAAAVIHNKVGQPELALHYADRVLADQPSPRTRCLVGHARLEALQALGKLAGESLAIQHLIKQCQQAGEHVGGHFLRGLLARQMAAAGQRREAIAMLGRYLPDMRAQRYARLVGETESLLAELLLAEGRPAEAEAHAREAVDNSAGMVNSLPLVAAHRVLYETARTRGDLAAALRHLQRLSEIERAYLDELKARELAVQMARHEADFQAQRIALLDEQNEVLRLEQRLAETSAARTRLLLVMLVVMLAFAAHFGWRTKRAQLGFRRMAETDALTGVSNRHHFSRRAAAALEYCRKGGEDAALVMFDLDEFKAINDRHGHALGDWVLQQVAAACREACRKNDLFGRLGGEEFAFLLVGGDVQAGLALARDCRARLAAIDASRLGAGARISASFGVADARGGGYDFLPLLAAADAAMYQAKREGRDRIALAAPPTAQPATA